MATEAPPVPRLKERYRAEVAPALRDEFGFANVMQVPGLTKIVVNMGVGEAARDAKLIEGAVRDLSTITSTRENFFGFLRHDFSPKPAFTAYQQAALAALG